MCVSCFPTATAEETILSPLTGLGTFFENQSTIDVWLYFWALKSMPLLSESIFTPLLYCLDYCGFAESFGFRKWWVLQLFLFQEHFGYWGPLNFHKNFRTSLYFPQRSQWHCLCRSIWEALPSYQFWVFWSMNMGYLSISSDVL